MSTPRIALLLDGPAPALLVCARRVLDAVADGELVEAREDDRELLRGCDAVLADRPVPAAARELGHDVALLAVRATPPLLEASPLRDRRAARADLLLACPLAGGGGERAVALALDAAERRSGRLAVVDGTAAPDAVGRLGSEHPDVAVERVSAAGAAEVLLADPSRFDVLVSGAEAGDVLSGVAAGLTGLAAMAARATVGESRPGVFAPYRAVAAGTTANPLPVVLAAALLLREGLGMEAEAERLEVAVEAALESGLRTPDLLLGGVGERRTGTEGLIGGVLAALGRE